MRSYQLQPGKLLEWEGAWRRGLEARAKFVVCALVVLFVVFLLSGRLEARTSRRNARR